MAKNALIEEFDGIVDMHCSKLIESYRTILKQAAIDDPNDKSRLSIPTHTNHLQVTTAAANIVSVQQHTIYMRIILDLSSLLLSYLPFCYNF